MTSFTDSQLITVLNSLAPPEGAAEWDNTGVLLESGPGKSSVTKILITLDLTPAVTKEAIRKNADWIISYHPPIFSGLTTLSRREPLTAALLDLHRAGISVYSPHTALDAAEGGVSDWLCEPFSSADIENVEGSGRILTFAKALKCEELSDSIQKHLNSPYLRISRPAKRRNIKRLGLCPGAGASVLRGLDVDAVFTGEMRHHDLLSWQSSGVYVFLSEHGHTERPYLPVFQKRLSAALPKSVQVICSQKDREPVELYLSDA